MLSDIQLAHDLVKSEMPESGSKAKLLLTLNVILFEAKTLTDELAGLKKQVKHHKFRNESLLLENEKLRGSI